MSRLLSLLLQSECCSYFQNRQQEGLHCPIDLKWKKTQGAARCIGNSAWSLPALSSPQRVFLKGRTGRKRRKIKRFHKVFGGTKPVKLLQGLLGVDT